MKNLIVIIGTLAVLLSSCTVQKRHYLKGYYLNFNKSKQSEQKNDLKEPIVKTKHPLLEPVKPRLIESKEVKEPVLLATTKPIAVKTKIKQIQNYLPQKKDVKKAIKIMATTPEKEKNYGYISLIKTLLIIFGIMLTIPGIYMFLYIDIILGAILAVLGIGAWIAGIAIRKPKKAETKLNTNGNEYQDVVYLKNGSIIRGLIIEQIPGISIKVETKDGNVFVYKMEEIDRMTKEKQR